jgi:esterase/lipase
MKKTIVIAISAISVLFLLFMLGPKPPKSMDIPDSDISDATIETIDKIIEEKEASVGDVKEKLNKGIVWLNGEKKKREFAIVYIHGFTAARYETYPLSEMIADEIDANIFYTRLKAHGLTHGETFGETKTVDWLLDVKEAYDVGKIIGSNVIFIGASTGCPLITYFVSKINQDVSHVIFISPNFKPKNPRTEIVLMPWGTVLAQMFGEQRISNTIRNEDHAYHWTSDYPKSGAFPMMGAVQLARNADFSSIKMPILVMYTEEDDIINTEVIPYYFDKIASTQKKLIKYENGDQHIFVGNLTTPENNDEVAEIITEFIISTN